MLTTRTEELGDAAKHLKRLSADEKTRLWYEARELYRMDEQVSLRHARAKGRQEIISRMLARGVAPKEVADLTGIPLAEVRKMKERGDTPGRRQKPVSGK